MWSSVQTAHSCPNFFLVSESVKSVEIKMVKYRVITLSIPSKILILGDHLMDSIKDPDIR